MGKKKTEIRKVTEMPDTGLETKEHSVSTPRTVALLLPGVMESSFITINTVTIATIVCNIDTTE